MTQYAIPPKTKWYERFLPKKYLAAVNFQGKLVVLTRRSVFMYDLDRNVWIKLSQTIAKET